MISVNKKYKYKDLCVLMGQNTKTGKARQLQLRDWHRYFNWENPTSQVYLITEVFEEPEEKKDGRKSNGAKVKLQDEFDYLFNAFCQREHSRNAFNVKARWGNIYFTNSELDIYFGLRCKNYYDAKNDDSVSDVAFQKVTKKIAEKRRSWIIDKIKKNDKIDLQDGIIAYKNNNEFDYRDDFLDEWNTHQNTYMKAMGYRCIGDVIDKEKWFDMIEYISLHFEGYVRVVKCHKIQISVSMLKEFEFDEIENYKMSINRKLVEELNAYFGKQNNADDYIGVVNKYVKLYKEEKTI